MKLGVALAALWLVACDADDPWAMVGRAHDAGAKATATVLAEKSMNARAGSLEGYAFSLRIAPDGAPPFTAQAFTNLTEIDARKHPVGSTANIRYLRGKTDLYFSFEP